MLAFFHLFLVAVLAWQLQSRVTLLDSFRGFSRYFLSLGLTLFLVNWANFLLYAALGWGPVQQSLSWLILIVPLPFFYGRRKARDVRSPSPQLFDFVRPLGDFRRWNYWFLFLAGFVLFRFYFGITTDERGAIWCNFNFYDTPFHLSVTNAFLASPRFPPTDLDAAPFPLKYHFLADFYVAQLVQLGLPPLRAMWFMNLVSATVMMASLWAVFERWLRLSARWIMLAGFVFLFLNMTLVNLIHYLAYAPQYYDQRNLYDGLIRFQYFNFESMLGNLLEPQRGLLFTLPVVLLIMAALFGERRAAEPVTEETRARWRRRILQVVLLVCLLPFAHIVSFCVLTFCAVPAVWRERNWLLRRAWLWGPVFAVGVGQLWYLLCYGPPTNAAYSGWDAMRALPLHEFSGLPRFGRWIVFWFFVNGDFLFWGGLFAVLVFFTACGRATGGRIREFVREWRWYLVVCAGFFVLINFYRYAFEWGDSNKFVFFLNLGLTLIIVLGAAQWAAAERRGKRVLSHILWCFFLLLSLTRPVYGLYRWTLVLDHDMILMFTQNDRDAAEWLRHALRPEEQILTSANNQIHFVSALAGRRTLAGIYGDSNPYRRDGVADSIRRIYEGGEFQLLGQIGTKFVCVSAHERRRYSLHPKWVGLMERGTGVVFHSGGGPEDDTSVFIFDRKRLEELDGSSGQLALAASR